MRWVMLLFPSYCWERKVLSLGVWLKVKQVVKGNQRNLRPVLTPVLTWMIMSASHRTEALKEGHSPYSSNYWAWIGWKLFMATRHCLRHWSYVNSADRNPCPSGAYILVRSVIWDVKSTKQMINYILVKWWPMIWRKISQDTNIQDMRAGVAVFNGIVRKSLVDTVRF